MRVLHVIPGVAPRYGGPSTAIWPMVAALNRLAGVSAEVATTDADGPGGRLDPQSLPPSIVTHLFSRNFSEQWKFSAGLWRWLRRHAVDYDLLHVHAIWSFSTMTAGAAARRAEVPYIVRPAGMLSEFCLDQRAFKKRLYWALLERKTLFHASAFHATGPDEARDIEAVRAGAKTFVIPQAVEEAAIRTPPAPHVLRRLCARSVGNKPIVLFLGRLHPVKGVADVLLPAFARLITPSHLALAGGPDSRTPGYNQLILEGVARLGLADRVSLLGPVPQSDRWALFDGAAVFVLPSHSENFGLVVAEAMARGCPVVATAAVQASNHVIAAGAGRVVPVNSATALADALDGLLAVPTELASLGAAGREYVATQLTWDRAAERLRDMYFTVVRGTHRHQPPARDDKPL